MFRPFLSIIIVSKHVRCYIMIISGKQIQGAFQVYNDQKQVSKSINSPKTGQTQKNDEVILSSQGQEFAQILQTAKNTSEVQVEKVNNLSEQISSGTYAIDSQAVAGKIIESTLAYRLR